MANKHEPSTQSQARVALATPDIEHRSAPERAENAADWWQSLMALSLLGAHKKTPTRLALKAMYGALVRQMRRLTYSWQAVGPRTLLRNSWRWATDPEARCVDSGFDSKYGTDTNALLTPREAAIPGARRRSATMYVPSMDQDLTALLGALPWSESLQNNSTFVDMGSGKGRVVLLAAMRRFHNVVGVELSPVLHDVAKRNQSILHEAGALQSPLHLTNCDATDYVIPDSPILMYMYHPFNESVTREVVHNLLDSLRTSPRPAAIMYCHPTLQPCIGSNVFTTDDVFTNTAHGLRHTRRFELCWTLYTNDSWLSAHAPSVAPASCAL